MIRNKKKFIDSYSRYISSKDFISSNRTFSYTTSLSWDKFESCIDIEHPKLKNIFFVNKLSKKFKMLSAGKHKSFSLDNKSKDQFNYNLKKYIKDIHSINHSNETNIPAIVGGQNFDINKKNDDIWSNVPRLEYWIPKILFLDNNGISTVTHFFDTVLKPDNAYEIIDHNCSLIDSLIKNEFTSNKNIIIDNEKNHIDKKKFSNSINEIKRKIKSKKVSKVVISNIISFDIEQRPSFVPLLENLTKNYSNCSVFYKKFNDSQIIIGATPELIIKKTKNELQTNALAGSKPIENKDELLSDSKIIEEHDIVVKGIIDNLKSFNLKSTTDNKNIFELKNISHIITKINSKVDDRINPLDILDSLVPTPALCGYPKKESLKMINNLEDYGRGRYAGPIGWINLDMNCEFYAAIRTAYFNKNKLYFYGGAGIVINSNAEQEWDEIERKINAIKEIINE